MLSVWWDYKDVVYFELLPRNQTINSDVYCQQLIKLDEAIKEKRLELVNRKGIVFHHDNARSHTSLVTRGKLLELGKWCRIPDTALTWRHPITIYFEVCKILWMIKLSLMMMTWNRTWFSFLLIRIRSSKVQKSAESWNCLKDSKRSSDKVENI